MDLRLVMWERMMGVLARSTYLSGWGLGSLGFRLVDIFLAFFFAVEYKPWIW